MPIYIYMDVCVLIFPFYSARYVGVERDICCNHTYKLLNIRKRSKVSKKVVGKITFYSKINDINNRIKKAGRENKNNIDVVYNIVLR